jgi:hypothetical protein
VAENKTRQTEVSVSGFIAGLKDEARRADARAIANLMGAASGEEARMWGPSIIGFGVHHYVYESGREGDTPMIGFSPRSAAHVLYGVAGFDGAEALLAKLGKHTRGKGCVYVKKLADVDPGVLDALVRGAVKAKRNQ